MEVYGLHNIEQEFPPGSINILLLNYKGKKCAFSLGVNNIRKIAKLALRKIRKREKIKNQILIIILKPQAKAK